jgi:hypothetical protein
MYVVYATALALGIIAIGKSTIGRMFIPQNWPLEGKYDIYATALALVYIAIGNIIIGIKFMHHLWKACVLFTELY